MKILHIANDFSSSKVHANLYKELDKLGIEQTVFNPIRVVNKASVGCNEFKAGHTKFVYAPVVKPIHHYVYHIKRRCVFNAMIKMINVKNFNIVHATTLLTDGGLAYLLYKKYNIPYVVSVRNTDVNGFFDKMPHTWFDARKILLHAKRIFFISPALKKKFENHRAVKALIPSIKGKFVLQPNGIDDYFLDNVKAGERTGHGIIYIGDFSNNKNVCRLINAILKIHNLASYSDIKLTLVGGGNNENDCVEKMIHSHPEIIKYLGKITDKESLCKILCQNSIFAMPSITETFGLVYLEALSQNLAVIYTKGQGIDGLFPTSVGIAVNPFDVEEIMYAIKQIIDNRKKYGNRDVDFSLFRWSSIAEKYQEYYKQVLGCANVDFSKLKGYHAFVGGGGI